MEPSIEHPGIPQKCCYQIFCTNVWHGHLIQPTISMPLLSIQTATKTSLTFLPSISSNAPLKLQSRLDRSEIDPRSNPSQPTFNQYSIISNSILCILRCRRAHVYVHACGYAHGYVYTCLYARAYANVYAHAYLDVYVTFYAHVYAHVCRPAGSGLTD